MTKQTTPPLKALDLGTLTDAGLAALADLKVSTSQEGFGGTFGGSVEEWKGRTGPNTYGFSFFIEGRTPIGMVLLKHPPESPAWVPPHAVSLHGLKIAEAFQGQGLGHAALSLSVEQAKSCWPEARTLILAVDAENIAALSLYRRFGMSDSGPIFEGRIGREHRLAMSLPVKPEDGLIA